MGDSILRQVTGWKNLTTLRNAQAGLHVLKSTVGDKKASEAFKHFGSCISASQGTVLNPVRGIRRHAQASLAVSFVV